MLLADLFRPRKAASRSARRAVKAMDYGDRMVRFSSIDPTELIISATIVHVVQANVQFAPIYPRALLEADIEFAYADDYGQIKLGHARRYSTDDGGYRWEVQWFSESALPKREERE